MEFYHIFQTIRRTPQMWGGNGGASYSPNVADLVWGRGTAVERVFLSYFPPLKPRYVLWSGASYGLKNTVIHSFP